MTNKKLNIEELLSDESFIEFVNFGSHKEKWQKLMNDEENGTTINEARDIINSMRIREEYPNQLTKERIRRNIDTRIKHVNHHGPKELINNTKPFKFKSIWYAAAIIALLIVGSVSYVFVDWSTNAQDNVQQHFIVKSTQSGQKLTVFLPDGSRVKLNANSKIEYPETFTGNLRKVKLDGEAFFEVERNVDKPFIVDAGDISTRVLGTTFNIRSYPEEGVTKVILATGKVEVSSNMGDKHQSVTLEPGMKVNYIRKENKIITAKANLDELLWKEGVILFDKASRKEVFKTLEKWYGVTFDLSGYENIKDNWDYSARFDNKNLENVLQSISYVKKFSFEIENNKVIIHKN